MLKRQLKIVYPEGRKLVVNEKHTWSKPFHGVQHLGGGKNEDHWFTVSAYKTFAIATHWFPGCRYSPKETHHDNAEQARKWCEDKYKELCQ